MKLVQTILLITTTTTNLLAKEDFMLFSTKKETTSSKQTSAAKVTTSTHTEIEKFSKQLTFDSIAALKDADTQLKSIGDAADRIVSYVREKEMKKEINKSIEKHIPEIEKKLKETPNLCALIEIIIDKHIGNPNIKNIRYSRFVGVGDTAVQTLAKEYLETEKTGIAEAWVSEGYIPDPESTHYICIRQTPAGLQGLPIYQPFVPLMANQIKAEIENSKTNTSNSPSNSNPKQTNWDGRLLPSDRPKENKPAEKKSPAETPQKEKKNPNELKSIPVRGLN